MLRRSRWITVGLTVAAVILLGTAGVVGIRMLTAPHAHTAIDMRGNPVVVDPGTAPSRATVSAMHVTPDTGTRLTVPSVGLDVPLGALNAVRGTITPPGFTQAYWVRNVGVSVDGASRGTVYVVMHSVRGGGVAPGNYLIDVRDQRAKVANGATITVGDAAYSVTGSAAVPKEKLSSDAQVWQSTPGRLVIITCLQVPANTPSVDNMVIFATLT